MYILCGNDSSDNRTSENRTDSGRIPFNEFSVIPLISFCSLMYLNPVACRSDNVSAELFNVNKKRFVLRLGPDDATRR